MFLLKYYLNHGVSRLGYHTQKTVVTAHETVSIIHWVWSAIAGITSGISVALVLAADYGASPGDMLTLGIAAQTGVTIGQASWIFLLMLGVAGWVLGHRPSVRMIVFMVTSGWAIDASMLLINRYQLETATRVMFLLSGMLGWAITTTILVHNAEGGGFTDKLMSGLCDRFGFRREPARLVFEISAIIVGVLLGGSFGWATIFIAVTIPYLIEFMIQASQDYLDGRRRRIVPLPERVQPYRIVRRPSIRAGSEHGMRRHNKAMANR